VKTETIFLRTAQGTPLGQFRPPQYILRKDGKAKWWKKGPGYAARVRKCSWYLLTFNSNGAKWLGVCLVTSAVFLHLTSGSRTRSIPKFFSGLGVVGTLRLFLALSVVAWHLWGFAPAPMITGPIAVVLFFMISGFYMSMIVNERYAKLPISAFYLSRALRLYPVYAAVLLAAVGFQYYADQPIVFFKSPFANATMVGVDMIDWSNRALPQAWTISIELEFYLIAPLLLGRSLKLCLAVLAGLITLRLAFLPYDYLEWRFFFAPTVWCFFVIGHVGHRLSVYFDPNKLRRIGWGALVLLPALGYVCGLREVVDLDRARFWLFYLVFAAAIPSLFALTKSWRFDALLGELSYPIYICHWTVIGIMGYFWAVTYDYRRVVVLGSTITVACVLYALVQRPVDTLRGWLRVRDPYGRALAPMAALSPD
jgi:peptidoglycan/LPS O-acetylase OafA/YrhL